MKEIRYMGLDFGSKTIGIAVSDPFNSFSQSIEIIKRVPTDGLKKSIVRIRELVNYYNVDEFVLGMPYKMNEQIGDTGLEVLAFKKRLEKEFNLPVNIVDERKTTVVAENILLQADLSRGKRKEAIDKLAAAIILQRFLDIKKGGTTVSKEKDMEDDEFVDLDTLVLYDDETDEEIECAILDRTTVNGAKYLLVIECAELEDDEADPDAIILKEGTDDDGEPMYEFIEEDEEFDLVSESFRKNSKEYDI